jgi:YgiT-type zinc finger domain-containing protein
MSRKPESDGIPAEVVIAKLEAKLQAALDKRGLRRCQYCRLGILKPEVRDVVITREERSAIVRNIAGRFCDQCGGRQTCVQDPRRRKMEKPESQVCAPR